MQKKVEEEQEEGGRRLEKEDEDGRGGEERTEEYRDGVKEEATRKARALQMINHQFHGLCVPR